MKLKKIHLFVSFILVILSINVSVLATELTRVPSLVHGNTVVAPSDTTVRATGAEGWYSENKNVYWAGHNVSQSQGSSLSVNIVQKNGLDAFQTRVFNTSTGKYSGIAYRVSHAHVDGQPNYTQTLETAGVHEFGFEVTYFDSREMAGNWLLCYMTWSNTLNNVHKSFGHYGLPLVQYEGTNTWKRVRWTYDYGSDLTKWNFYSDGAEREDFKFYSVKGRLGSTSVDKDDSTVGPTYIHDFTMLPLDEFNEYCEKATDTYVTAHAGGVISYNMESSIADYNRGDGRVIEVANRFGANIYPGAEVSFAAPTTVLSAEKGAIVVDCYAEEETKIVITDGENIRRVVHPGGSWQTLRFLYSEISSDDYTLTADKNIQIASIHYEATDEEIPPYDTEEEEEEPEEEIPVILADIIAYLEPTVTSDGTDTTVTYRLTSAPEGKRAVLIATYIDPETEKIIAINSSVYEDVSQIENRKMTVTIPDMSGEGYVLRHYLWANLNDVAPLGNYSPAAPGNVSAEISGTVAEFNWNYPQDDYDTESGLTYNIYDSGMLVAGGITGNQTELSGLILGEDYNFTVTATDSMGAESPFDKVVTGSVDMYNTIIAGEEAVGSSKPQKSEDGRLMFVGAVDNRAYYNTYKPSVVSGLTAYESIERTDDYGNLRAGAWSRIPFRIDPNYANDLKSAEIDEVGFEVVYFDSAELAGYYMNTYVSWGRTPDSIRVDAYGSAGYIPLTGSNTWKIYRGTFDLSGGWFAPNESNITRGNPHFEFYTVKGTTGSDRDITPGAAKIHSLTVLPIEEFNEYVSASGASVTINEGVVLSCNISGDLGEASVSEYDGRQGIDIAADEIIEFSVEDSSVIGSAGSIVVYAYAEEETNITVGTETKVHGGNGWQKIKFEQLPVIRDYTLTADNSISINSVRATTD